MVESINATTTNAIMISKLPITSLPQYGEYEIPDHFTEIWLKKENYEFLPDNQS